MSAAKRLGSNEHSRIFLTLNSPNNISQTKSKIKYFLSYCSCSLYLRDMKSCESRTLFDSAGVEA